MEDPSILICYDGSPSAREAIERTAQLMPGARVAVLSVWQPMEAFVASWGMMSGDIGHLDAEARKAAEQLAGEGATMARAAGLYPVEYAVQANASISRTILEWCREHEVRLVVVGATGRSAFVDAMTGSVANAVVHRASMPVLVVRAPVAGASEHAGESQALTTA